MKLKLDRNTKSGDISPATNTPHIQKNLKNLIVGVYFSALRKLEKKCAYPDDKMFHQKCVNLDNLVDYVTKWHSC